MEEEWAKGKVASGEEEESFDDIIKAGTEEEIKVTPKNLEILRTRVSKLEEEKVFRVGEQVCPPLFLHNHSLTPSLSLTHSLSHTGASIWGAARLVGNFTRYTHIHSLPHTFTLSLSLSHTHKQGRLFGVLRALWDRTRVSVEESEAFKSAHELITLSTFEFIGTLSQESVS
jgi:hypothetical protein